MASQTIDDGTTLRGVVSRARCAGRRSVPVAAQGAIVYAGIRLIGLLLTWYLLRHGEFAVRHLSLTHWILSGDSAFYLNLAEHGYGFQQLTPAHVASFAFFPGYPAAIALVALLPGISPAAAAFGVTIVSGLAAACGLARLGNALTGDRRISLIMVALWAAAPGAWTLSMAYTEAFYCALAVWTLCMLLERRWLTAALLTAVAGLVRFDAVALVCAVWLAAVIAIIRSVRAGEGPAAWWRPAVALVVAPSALVAYVAIVSVWTHRLDGWFWIQDNHWHQGFDGGRAMTHALWHAFLGLSDPPHTLIAIAIVGAIVLMLWTFAEPLPAMLRVYTVAVILHVYVENAAYFSSKPRYFLPAVLLALPLARLLATVRLWVAVPLLALLAVASTWFGLYITVIAHMSP
jgi:hypothetical protein